MLSIRTGFAVSLTLRNVRGIASSSIHLSRGTLRPGLALKLLKKRLAAGKSTSNSKGVQNGSREATQVMVDRELPPHISENVSDTATGDMAAESKSTVASKAGKADKSEDKSLDQSLAVDPELEALEMASAELIASRSTPSVFHEAEAGKITADDVPVREVKPIRQGKVARLAPGLQRVLFSPGVHHLRDPRTGVWNFPNRELDAIPRPEQFGFNRLPQYITASEDDELATMAEAPGLRFVGSTSTLTQSLSQIYFTLSAGRGVNLSNLSQDFAAERSDFTAGAQLPASIRLRLLPNGRYAIDNNKDYDTGNNILSDYGRILEKLLTSSREDFTRFLVSSPESAVPESERKEREAYCYSRSSTLLMRSQLDCQDSRLPGSGTFDIKTRACLPIRHDRANYKANSAYHISETLGFKESFEREYYDLTRSGMLKYCFQARIGQMDGIFLAYHNTVRCFGFQYLPVAELDQRLFGSTEMGNQTFNLCVGLFERILDKATEFYPGKNLEMTLLRKRSRPNKENDENELMVSVEPMDWDLSQPRPIRAISLVVQSELDGERVGADGISFSTDAEERAKQKWAVNYTIRVSSDDFEGYRVAHKHKTSATKSLLAMNSLYVPEGMSIGDMNKLAAFKNQAATLSAAKDKDDKEGEETVSSLVTDEKVTAIPRMRWLQPNPRVAALRAAAKTSGHEFSRRRKLWKKDSRKASYWHREDDPVNTTGSKR